MYYEQAKKVIEKAKNNGRPIGCFMSEIAISAAGVVIPPLGSVENSKIVIILFFLI